MRFRHSRRHLARTLRLLFEIKLASYTQLILSFGRTRSVARLADWVVGADKMRRGGKYDQRAKGEKMHDCRSYFSCVCCGTKVSLYQLIVTVFIQVQQADADQDRTGFD
jgi:hypothetical protein